MLRTPTALSFNRSLLVLLVLLLVLADIAAGRALVGNSFAPAAQNPAPVVPALEASSAPAPAAETAVPYGATGVPASESVRPAATPAATAVPATALPRATVPVGPTIIPAPGRDIPAVAPEPGFPGFLPPPGRE